MGMTGIVGRPAGLLAVALLLAACGGTTTQQDAMEVASVDGQRLTTADLVDSDTAGSTSNGTHPARAAIDALIDEHLMAQEALAEGLDHDPTVEHTLENARRRVLAEALASRLDRPQTPPTPTEIEDYYHQNPALFSERRVYRLAIFSVDSASLDKGLLAAVGHTTSVEALSQLLGRYSIHFELQQVERAADELPISQLPQYSAAKAWDVLVESDANGPATRLVQIAAIDSRPTSLETARPDIQRYLARRDKAKAVDAYLAGARARARITYSINDPAPSGTKQTPAAPIRNPTIAAVSLRSYAH
jgi:peptidyl-prolyl cis-trans isomerase C